MSLISHEFLTAEELAQVKGVCLRTVYNWVRSGEAPAHFRSHGMYWFYADDAFAYEPPKRGRRKNFTAPQQGDMNAQ